MEKQIKVRFEHSTIGCPPVQRKTVLGLGLKRLNQVRILKDTPAIRGMVLKVPHLVSIVEELTGTRSSTKQPVVSAAATPTGLLKNVIPAKAGIHKSLKLLDPRFREDDKKCIFQQSPTDPAKQSEPTVKTVKKVASAPHKKVAAKKVPTIKAKKTVKKKTV